ncbi:MAG: hypothetical protein HW421_3588 [Ignavibacteria bacterium]|nr:hypothetical protein [Ignavibacteria bacterium]
MSKNLTYSMKKSIALSAFFFLFFALMQSNAQEFFGRIKGPYGGEISCLAPKTDNTIYVGTWGDGFYKSTNGGNIWTDMNTGLNDLFINAVDFNSGNEIYLATEGGGVYYSSNEGGTWNQRNNGLTNLIVRTVKIHPDGDIFAGTYGSGVFRSTNRGIDWISVNNGLWFQNIKVLAVTREKEILAGTWGSGVYKSTDKGASWRKSNGGSLNNLFINDFQVNSTGEIFMATNGSGIWLSVTKGDNWNLFDTTKLPDLNVTSLCLLANGQEPVAATRALGLWYYDNYIYQEWRTSNKYQSGVTSVRRAPGGSVLFAAMPYDGIYKSTNNGKQWEQVGLQNLGPLPTVISSKTGVLLAGGKSTGLLRSTDYGTSWNQTGLTGKRILSLAFDSLNNMYAGAQDGLYRSSDGGTNWSLFGLKDSSIVSIAINSKNFVYAGVTYIHYTTNNGTTWRQSNKNDMSGYSVSGVDTTGAIYFGSPYWGFYRSTNDGARWDTLLPFGSFTGLKCMAFNQQGHVLLGTWEGIMRSTDRGTTWLSKKDTFNLQYPYVNTLTVNTSGHIFSGMNGGYGIYRTTNNGTKWDSLNPSITTADPGQFTSTPNGYSIFTTNVLYRSIVSSAMVAPQLISPTDATFGIERNPTFKWQVAPRAELYQFEISKTNDFSERVEYTTQSATYRSIEKVLEYNTTYYWRVRSKSNSALSSWSQVFTFKTVISPPVLRIPEKEKRGVPITSDFYWYQVDGAVKYDIQVSDDFGFAKPVFAKSDLTDTSVNVPGLKNLTYYFWRAKAKGLQTFSDWSEPWRFYTSVAPPKLRLPLNNSIGLDATVTMEWDTSVAALGYNIQIATDSTFPQLKMVFDGKTLDKNLHIMPNLDYDTKYYWRVRAYNDDGTSFYSEPWSFTTATRPPSLINPPDKSFNQPIDIIFKWSPYDTVKTYHLQIAKDSTFKSLTVNDSTVSPESKEIKNLDYYQDYYWRIRTKINGKPTSWSPFWTFRTMLQKPNLRRPAPKAMNQALNLIFMWDKVKGAEFYRIQLSKDNVFLNPNREADSVVETQRDFMELDSITKYYWRVAAYNKIGMSNWSEIGEFTTLGINSVPEEITSAFESVTAVPNPFDREVEIGFKLVVPTRVNIEVCDIYSMETQLLMPETLSSGEHKISWKPEGLPSGVYFCRIKIDNFSTVVKLILIK